MLSDKLANRSPSCDVAIRPSAICFPFRNPLLSENPFLVQRANPDAALWARAIVACFRTMHFSLSHGIPHEPINML
jgi:hypothetical protein